MRKIFAVVGMAITVVASTFAFSAPASAATGKCPMDANGIGFCLYYNSNQQGAYYRWGSGTGEVDDLAGYVFPNNGAGAGQPVKNNAASASYSMGGGCVCSNDFVRVFFYSGQQGDYDVVTSNTNVQLVKTYNENASWRSYYY
ncbi:Hypothetical Protein SSCG [Streptomyces leeuwenhoekii]|uniref:Secreted Protein n=2 Tax=Streptomyces leeuwenhoekii TaxID=1437453 RepID=A0A0F7VKR6_STRLW|nr:Hypothetical Protein SSCG [Streptomyces leeuwenhoekii]